MAEYNDLTKTLQELLFDKFSPKPSFTRGILGDGNGNVTVPERPDKSYVRFNRGANEFFEVFNRTVNPVEGWPVLIGELPWQPGLTQVVDTDWAAFEQSGWGDNIGDTSPHAPTHEWPDGSPGSDPVNVYQRAIVPLRTYASSTGTVVYTNAYEYEYQGSGHVWGGVPGLDLSPVIGSMPSGTMRFMGIYLDPDTNLLGIVTGATTVFTSAFDPPRVQFPANVLPSARVRVYGSQANVTEFDMRDARQPFSVANWWTAGGDLTGTYPNPQVSGLFGYPLEGGAPAEGDTWIFSGSLWHHSPAGGGGNVWPKAGQAGISDTQYTSIDDFLDSLAAGDQGIIGEGTYNVDHAGGHGVIAASVVGVKGSGIGVTILTDNDTYTIEVGSDTLEDMTVTNTKTTGGAAIVNSVDGGEFTRVKTISTASSGTARGFYLWDYGATLKDCEASVSGGGSNYAVYVSDSGNSPSVTIRGGYFDGDVYCTGAGATLHLDGPTITGSVTEASSGTITGWYYDSNGNMIQRDSIDIYPGDDEAGLFQRRNLWLSVTDHFNDFSGWSWDAVNFSGTPSTIDVSTWNSLATIYNSSAGTDFFGYKTVSASGNVDIYALTSITALAANYAYAGIRIDNPSAPTTNFFEVRMLPGTGNDFIKLQFRYDNGGGVSSTDYADGLPAGFYLLRLLYNDASNFGGFYYTKDSPSPAFIVSSGATWSAANVRVGLILGQVGAAGNLGRAAIFDFWRQNV